MTSRFPPTRQPLRRAAAPAAAAIAALCFGCVADRRGEATDRPGAESAATAVVGPRWFGTLMSNPANIARNVAAGVTHATVAVHWSKAEPRRGEFSAAYFAEVHALLGRFRAAGQRVVLDLGLHYPPPWVFEQPNSRFVNQYGDAFVPAQPGAEAVNAVFSRAMRAIEARYVRRVFRELGTEFDAVRLGWCSYAEAHYPFANHGGRTNLYWAFDDAAQGRTDDLAEGMPPCPVPGWTPGTASAGHRDARAFADWYLDSLARFIAWQVDVVRRDYRGRLLLLFPAHGLRPGQLENAIRADLAGTSEGETASARLVHGGPLARGYDFERWVAAIRDPDVVLHTTNLGWRGDSAAPVDDESDDPAHWSPVHYLSVLAERHRPPLSLSGENAGGDDAGGMRLCFDRMDRYGLIGIFWAFDHRLHDESGRFPTLDDFAANIARIVQKDPP